MAAKERHAALGVIEVGGRKVGDNPRKGEILELLGLPGRVHYRVRWEDGHETFFYPGGDTHVRAVSSPGGEPAVAELVELLRERRVEFELLPHRRTTSAEAEAVALGVLPQSTAKTVVARLDGGCVRAVVPASARLSLEKLGMALDVQPTLLSEVELGGAYPAFELGAVPPLGGPAGDSVVVDRALLENDYVVFEAGTHDASLRMRPNDLVTVAAAMVADISTGVE